MKIVQVSNFFKPSWEAGGPPRVVYEISKELINRGHDVTVLTTDGFKKRVNVEKNKPVDVDGIKTYYFKNISSRLAKKVFLTPYYAPIFLRKEIKNSDVIHIHELSTLAFMAYYYAQKYNVPIVFQAHGCLYINKNTQKSFLGKVWNNLFEVPVIKQAQKLIALNKFEFEDYKRFSVTEEKIISLNNGIDLSKYKNLEEINIYQLYNLKSNEKNILYLGRIHPSKGLDLLLDVFYELLKNDKTLNLIIAGPDDGYMLQLKKLISDFNLEKRVIFTGFVTGKNKIALLSYVDICILPSEFETFPLTLLESIACNTPIICSKNCGISDIINNKVGIASDYNKDSFIKAIRSVMYNEELYQNFQKECDKFIAEYEWKTIVNKLESIYLSIGG